MPALHADLSCTRQRPGVLGLTASPHAAEDLESALEARIVTPKDRWVLTVMYAKVLNRARCAPR